MLVTNSLDKEYDSKVLCFWGEAVAQKTDGCYTAYYLDMIPHVQPNKKYWSHRLPTKASCPSVNRKVYAQGRL